MIAKEEKQEKILIEVLHGLGDTVCALPMIKCVRDNFPEAHIVVLSKNVGGKEILEASNIYINEIYVLDIYKKPLCALKTMRKLKAKKFDIGINCCITPVKKANAFMTAVKPNKIYSIQKYGKCFDMLQDKVHFVMANFMAIDKLCVNRETNIFPQLYPKKSLNIEKMLNKDYNSCKKTIGICIGDGDYSLRNKLFRTGKVYTRGWGISNIIKLIDSLQKDNNIILIGGKLEQDRLNKIKSEIKLQDTTLDCVDKFNITESMALVKECDLLIGIDTGMQHIAAAVGTKTLSIFGPTNPKTHGAYAKNSYFIEKDLPCKYCYGSCQYVKCQDRKCLNNISVQEVLDKVKEILL